MSNPDPKPPKPRVISPSKASAETSRRPRPILILNPHPRAVSLAQWVLLLVPSVVVLAAPTLQNLDRIVKWLWVVGQPVFEGRPPLSNPPPKLLVTIGFSVAMIGLAVALCFWFGFRLEKWQRGAIWSVARAFGFGFLILFANFVVLMAVMLIHFSTAR